MNHLTRMSGRRICIAGIDTKSGRHVRPVSGRFDPLTRDLLRSCGGAFEVGAVVKLGRLKQEPEPPMFENYRFDPRRAKHRGLVDPDDYLHAIDAATSRNLQTIFGPELARDGRSLSTARGKGDASLGCIQVDPRAARLRVNSYKSLKLELRKEAIVIELPVTDIRCWEPDHETPRWPVIKDVNDRLRRGVPLRVMVGLGRPWSRQGEERHWLQANGLCLEDAPVRDRP